MKNKKKYIASNFMQKIISHPLPFFTIQKFHRPEDAQRRRWQSAGLDLYLADGVKWGKNVKLWILGDRS